MTARSYLYRTAFAVGDKIGTLGFKDIIENDVTIHHEQYAQYGAPLRLFNISGNAPQTATSRDWPYDGSDLGYGVLGVVSNPNVTLATGVGQASEDMVGLLIVMINGSAVGHVRRISTWVSGTRVATCSRVWDPVPTAGDYYVLLVDCFRHNQLHVKGEIIAGATNTLTFIPVFYDVPQDAAGSNARAPRRFEDQPLVLVSTGHGIGCTNASGYHHLSTYSVLTRGALGAKLRVTAKDNSYQLWAGSA